MESIIIDGRKIADSLVLDLTKQLEYLKFSPQLHIIQVGNLETSNLYVSKKIKTCSNLNINAVLHKFNDDVQAKQIIDTIQSLNQHTSATAIIVQLPLPKHLDTIQIVNTINPNKDVDGLTFINQGKLTTNTECFIPCTPLGILKLIHSIDTKIAGKHAVIIGRSLIVGKPLSQVLLNEDCTVSILHSKSENIAQICRTADILISATGSPKIINSDYVNPDMIIIDVGISRVNNKITGDVDFLDVLNKVKAITPVPAGVGPMTIAMLMKNVFKAAKTI